MNRKKPEEIQRLLAVQRKKIDKLDDQILKLLGERFGIVKKVAKIKEKNDIPAYLGDRVRAVRERNVKTGKKYGIDPHLIRTLYTLIIYQSCAVEEELKVVLSNKKKPRKK